jgi:hypothetical protein
MLRRKVIGLVGGFVVMAFLSGAGGSLEAANRGWAESLAGAPWWSRVLDRLEARDRLEAQPAKCEHGSQTDPNGCPKVVPAKCEAGTQIDPNGCPRG